MLRRILLKIYRLNPSWESNLRPNDCILLAIKIIINTLLIKADRMHVQQSHNLFSSKISSNYAYKPDEHSYFWIRLNYFHIWHKANIFESVIHSLTIYIPSSFLYAPDNKHSLLPNQGRIKITFCTYWQQKRYKPKLTTTFHLMLAHKGNPLGNTPWDAIYNILKILQSIPSWVFSYFV